MTPLEVCEALFGGYEAVAKAVGHSKNAPLNWRHASSSRAAGDFPSATVMRKLLDHSDQRRLGLTATHLVRGASRAEVDAILSQRGQLTATAAE